MLNQLNELLMAYAGQSHQKTRKCGPLKIQPGKVKAAKGAAVSNAAGKSDRANTNYKERGGKKG